MALQRQSGKMIPVAEGDFDVESEEFRILDSGACGAFVHGLEDEYKEVRNASIGAQVVLETKLKLTLINRCTL